ncbi:hypothetical protein NLU66_07485 [Brachybacterium sp. NBEC-018]|uniref:hypothetical protein n=1 Tax=Brachybacterium sp. NBEC-018 TaxID=2996004 RepID=UPI002174F828|nr:hypothetical protein [Brachybacterium sp. NBEC-018]UVY85422.1 hypothetical protein NLU66_07485 [Brachybacterium sp. NBEC-018]
MQLTFLFQHTDDLAADEAFFRDELGWQEAWRDGGRKIAYRVPDAGCQVMVSETDQPAGPMYLVPDLAAWIDAHPGIAGPVPPYRIPGGQVAGFTAPGGGAFYVFDQPDAAGE